MKIQKLIIEGFGRYRNYSLDLSEGVNVIYGLNESGKSTLTAFLICMMFDTKQLLGNEYSKELLKKYEPWDYDRFGGEMYFYHEGINYRLVKTFGSLNRESLYNADTNTELYPANEYFGRMFPGLTAFEYLNTYFNSVDTQDIEPSVIQSVRRHAARNSINKHSEIDTNYALHILEERRRSIYDGQLAGKIAALEETIKSEEAMERELDRIAYREMKGMDEIESINIELEKSKKPTAFEEREQEYYRNKERYLTYKQNVSRSRQVNEELEKTIILLSELDENEKKLERCKEELSVVRKYIKGNDEKSLNLRHEASGLGKQIVSEGRNTSQKQMFIMLFALLCIICGVVSLFERSAPAYYTAFFAVGSIAVIFCAYLGVTGQRIKNNLRALLEKNHNEQDITAKDREEFFRVHSGENELMKRLESYLKEDGRRPDILKKEQELSDEAESLGETIKTTHDELLAFFEQFGTVEELKDDELNLQEENLINESRIRNARVKELDEKLTSLKESLIKMHMQVEAGEENEARLFAHREELKMLLEKKEAFANEEKAIRLASDIITKLTKEGSEGANKIVNQVASTYAASFTSNRYTSVITDENLDTKVDYYDKYVESDSLSTGTKSQLNLAVRLSAGDIVLGDYNLPMVFDDAFVYYDDERLADTLKSIVNHSGQSFIFTCQSREAMIMDQLAVDYRMITLA